MPQLSRWWNSTDPPLSPFETLNPLWGHVSSRLGYCVRWCKSGEDILNIHQEGGENTPCLYQHFESLGSKWQGLLALWNQQCVPTFSMHVPVINAPPICSVHWSRCELHRMFAATEYTHSSGEPPWHFRVYSKLYNICNCVWTRAASYFHMWPCDW